ncbi:MAG: hypothetical protein V2J25_17350 [Desulfatiglans sp.]|nr:hypothetical protein [Thermodesulfobacteriota bacterium]MEE4354625.1 hypothetical protein [Desulfatiglans sp.]
MSKLVAFFGICIGAGIGLWLGAKVGPMTAVLCASLGAGIGLYLIRRFMEDFLE